MYPFSLHNVQPRVLIGMDNWYHICECEDTIMSLQVLHETINKFFTVESLGVRAINTISSEELKRAEQIMKSLIIQEGNRYKICLLWKYDSAELPNSHGIAVQRLECIEKRTTGLCGKMLY